MAVIISSDAERHWYRDVLISPDELYCSPRAPNSPPRFMSRPTGSYDIAQYVKSLPAPWCDPSLLVVLDEMAGNSIPYNLAGLKCPKVIIVCDTHHAVSPRHGPIWRPIHHTLAERYDLVIGQFDRHHLHFFREAGINAAWLPCITLTPFEHSPDTPKKFNVSFVGNTGLHPFRNMVLQSLEKLGVHVDRHSMPQRETAALHAQSRINLNISLNADLNLRHFEVLAAGGFLVTEKLSPESGLFMLLEDRKHMAAFDNIIQLSELIRYYLANPAAAAEIAAAGQAEFRRFHQPAVKIQQMYDMIDGRTPDALDLRHDRRTSLPRQNIDSIRSRVALYEFLQELHRTNMRLEVVFFPGMERHATDAIDLPRLNAAVVQGNAAGAAEIFAAQLDARFTWVLPAELQRRFWNIAVCPAAMMGDAAVQQCLQTRRFDLLVLPDFSAQRDSATMQMLEQRFRLTRIPGAVAAFALPPAAG